jgi:hypothetical protein
MSDLQAGYAAAARLIDQADALVIAAGAGIGVDSGLPDFRGAEGFWRAYPALGRAGLRFEEIASPAAFRADPELAWGFYGHRLKPSKRRISASTRANGRCRSGAMSGWRWVRATELRGFRKLCGDTWIGKADCLMALWQWVRHR